MRQAVKAVSTVAWGFPPGFVAGRLTEDGCVRVIDSVTIQ